MKEFWNARYQEADYAYGEAANVFFREQLAQLPAFGKLLLPMEGEGRNAVFASTQGWDVTAFDFSESGQRKAQALAEARKVNFQYLIAEASTFDYGHQRYDAIALIFAHLPPEIRTAVHAKVIHALKPGGVVIVDSFHPNQLQHPSGGPKAIEMLYTLDMLRQDFKSLKPDFEAEVLTELHEGAYHKGSAFVTRFTAKKV